MPSSTAADTILAAIMADTITGGRPGSMILKVAADPTELPDRVRAELTGADHAVAPDRFAGAAQPVRDVEVLLELVPQWDMDERPAVQ